MLDTAYISAQRDVDLVKNILATHQAGDGEAVAKELLANRLKYEALEFSELPFFDPLKPFIYQQKEVDGQIKFTPNNEDLDITEITLPSFRRGTQTKAMENLKAQALEAEPGTTFFRVSLMQQVGEDATECDHKKTQIDLFTKKENGDLELIQLQTRKLTTIEQAEAVLRWWSQELELEENPDLDELLVAVGKRRAKVNINELLSSIDEQPVPNLEELLAEVQQKAVLAAQKYFNVIQNSSTVWDVASSHQVILKQIIYSDGGLVILVGGGSLDANCPTNLSVSSENKQNKKCPKCGVVNICGDGLKCVICRHNL